MEAPRIGYNPPADRPVHRRRVEITHETVAASLMLLAVKTTKDEGDINALIQLKRALVELTDDVDEMIFSRALGAQTIG